MSQGSVKGPIQIKYNYQAGYAKLVHVSAGYKIYVSLLPILGGRIKLSHKAFRRASDAAQYREDVMNRYRSLKRVEIENELRDKQNSSD